jgi:hypothetical protein
MSTPIKVGDIWYRVDGVATGDEIWDGSAELVWQEWRVKSLTPCGAWLVQPYGDFTLGKPRFALADSCRWAHRTKNEALRALVRRKNRHIAFLNRDLVVAEMARGLALQELNHETHPPHQQRRPDLARRQPRAEAGAPPHSLVQRS